MAKKSKKSAAPQPVQGESFFNEGQAPAASPTAAGPAQEAGPVVLKRKRSYKPRAKPTALKSAGMSHQDAYNMGFKAGLKVAKMGA